MNWISVKERLPEEWDEVFAWDALSGAFVCERDGKEWRDSSSGATMDDVTHWAEIEPPMEDTR
jgi:hypothetical protein